MKNKIIRVLLLLLATALVSMPCVASTVRREDIIETDVAAQPETTSYKRSDNIFINKKKPKIIHEPIQYKSTLLFSLILADKKTRKESRELEKLIFEMEEEIRIIESTKDKEEFFIEYKNIVEKYKDVVTPPNTIYDEFSEEELDLLFKVVQAEIGEQYSFEQKCNVVSVIFNRMAHDRFPNTLLEVLTYDQFTTISNGSYKTVEVTELTKLACEYVYIFGATNNALFFNSHEKTDSFCGANYMFSDGSGHSFYGYCE